MPSAIMGQQHAPAVLIYAPATWWLLREWLCCTPRAPHPSGSPVVLRALRKPAFPAIEGGVVQAPAAAPGNFPRAHMTHGRRRIRTFGAIRFGAEVACRN